MSHPRVCRSLLLYGCHRAVQLRVSESLVVHFGLQCQGSPPVLRAVGSGRSFGAFAAAREPPSRRGSVALLGVVVRVALPARLVVWSSGGDCRAVRSWVTRDLGLLSSGWACRPFQWAWEHRDRREGLRLVAILPFGTCSGANLKPSKWSRVPVSDFTLCYKVFLYSCMLVNPSS